MNNAILVDIDGTCCDSRFPISYLNGERDTANYEVYYRTLDLSVPIMPIIIDIIDRVEDYLCKNSDDISLVFLTGRTAQIDAVYSTLDFINKNFDLIINNPRVKVDFYFRPLNYHVPALEYKITKFSMLKSVYNFLHIYEDELSNVKMFDTQSQEGCVVHWVKSSYSYALEEQDTVESFNNVITHTI